jgi:hypothetical protein
MKDTLRTASVTESYNEADDAIREKKAPLIARSIEIKKLRKDNDISHMASGASRIVGIVFLIGFSMAIVMIAALVIGDLMSSNDDKTPAIVSIFVGLIVSIVIFIRGLKAISKKNPKSKEDLSHLDNEEQGLAKQLQLLEHQQAELSAKKRALLLGEVSIANRDMKIVKKEQLEERPIEIHDTKVCPDCAEDVKILAKICRFCNHKFE